MEKVSTLLLLAFLSAALAVLGAPPSLLAILIQIIINLQIYFDLNSLVIISVTIINSDWIKFSIIIYWIP